VSNSEAERARSSSAGGSTFSLISFIVTCTGAGLSSPGRSSSSSFVSPASCRRADPRAPAATGPSRARRRSRAAHRRRQRGRSRRVALLAGRSSTGSAPPRSSGARSARGRRNPPGPRPRT
jgi:hypothetical protein